MKVLFSGVNMSSIIKMLCVLVLLICYRDGFSQKPQTQILKHELSKKALKKGRLSASAMSQDSANYYTVFNYQPKKKQPAQRDVSVFNSDGSFKEVLTYPMSADLFKELNLRPLTEEEEMSIASDHGFSPGPAVVLKGFYMHVKTGRVELAGYETDLNFGLSYQGKKIPLMEGKHRLEYSFVDDSKSRYAPYYPFIAKSVRAGWRGRWEDFTPVYGVFHPDEKILFGAIMVGKVDLKSDNSDFARYRYYVGMLDGSTLEVENPQYFEFGYQLNKTMDRSIDQNGNMVVVLEGQKLKDPENPLSGAVKKRSVIQLVFSSEGELLSQEVFDSEKDVFTDVKDIQLHQLNEGGFMRYGMHTKNNGKPKSISFDFIGDKKFQCEFSMEQLEAAQTDIPGEKNKFKFAKAGQTLFMEDVRTLANGDVLVIAQSKVVGGSSVTLFNKELGAEGSMRFHLFQLSSKDGSLKRYYEWGAYKKSEEFLSPQVVERGSDVFLLFRSTIVWATEGYHNTGDIEYTISGEWAYGSLVKYNADKGIQHEVVEIDKAWVTGYLPMMVTNEGVVLVDLSSQYLPKKKIKASKLVVSYN